MNASCAVFFSGFSSRQFTEEIAHELRGILNDRNRLVFISAWPDRYKQNDEDSMGMHNMFVIENMSFSSFCVIDERMDPAVALKEIENASCLFLMGGNATAQMGLIRRKGIFDKIKNYKGVILGVSAGSMNMGDPAVDIYESNYPYVGLGFCGITVKAHYPIKDENLRCVTEEVSYEIPVTLMKDESAIFITESNVKLIGEIYLMRKGQISLLTDDNFQKEIEKR